MGRQAKGSEAYGSEALQSDCYVLLAGAAAEGVRPLNIFVPIRRRKGCVPLLLVVLAYVLCPEVALCGVLIVEPDAKAPPVSRSMTAPADMILASI